MGTIALALLATNTFLLLVTMRLEMQRTEPRRIVLRFRVDHELEEAAIIHDFFTTFRLNPGDDYYSHLMAPNESTSMHIVLDMHCKTNPTADLETMAYEVFKVKKNTKLFVRILFEVARLLING